MRILQEECFVYLITNPDYRDTTLQKICLLTLLEDNTKIYYV